MNPISTAAAGLASAANRFDQASLGLSVAAAGGPGDLATAAVDQITAKLQFEAEAKAMKAIEATQKQALDILV
jgi:hypothetical protein